MFSPEQLGQFQPILDMYEFKLAQKRDSTFLTDIFSKWLDTNLIQSLLKWKTFLYKYVTDIMKASVSL